MKWKSGALLALSLYFLIGCDPGMSIRQVNSVTRPPKPVIIPSELVLDVKTTHQLIGESWYDPEVRITNRSQLAATVTKVELVALAKTYAPSHPDGYPLQLGPGESQVLKVFFELEHGVQETFKKRADLRVYYEIGGEKQIAIAKLAGGSLKYR